MYCCNCQPLDRSDQDQVRAMRERGVSAVNAGMADDELAESVFPIFVR